MVSRMTKSNLRERNKLMFREQEYILLWIFIYVLRIFRTVLCDITTYLPPATPLGVMLIAGLPCTGPVVQGFHTDALPPIMHGHIAPLDADAAQKSLFASSALLFVENTNPGADFLEKSCLRTTMAAIFFWIIPSRNMKLQRSQSHGIQSAFV